VKRAGRCGLLRNVAKALGSRGSPEAAPVVSEALSDGEPLLREQPPGRWGRSRLRRRPPSMSRRSAPPSRHGCSSSRTTGCGRSSPASSPAAAVRAARPGRRPRLRAAHSRLTPLGSHRALGSRGGRRREDARPPPAASGMVAFPTTRPHVFAPSRRGDPYSPPDLGGGCRHIGSDHPHRSRGTPPPGGGAAPASHRPPAAGPGSHRHARGLRTRGQRRPNRRRARASGASRLHQVRQQRVKVLALRLRLRRRPEHPDR
jgi:hypothetical protein